MEKLEDVTDDSASSYYTALCSLSEYSEDVERTSTSTTECLSMNVSFEALDYETSRENITSIQERKTDYDQNKEKTETNCEPGTPAELIQKLDPTEDLNLKAKYSSIKLCDFGGDRVASCNNITATEEHNCSQPKMTSTNTFWIKQTRNEQDVVINHNNGGTKPNEKTQTLCEGPGACSSIPRDDRDECVLVHFEKKGEKQRRWVSCRKEQAELSLRSRNRKVSANCISTLSASNQESRIPPHCYSECIPATRHPQQSLAHTQRLEKQRQPGFWPLSATMCSSSTSWQPCHSMDKTKESTIMETKLAEVNTKVEGLGNLAQVRSSYSETDYLHVSTSSCSPTRDLSADGNQIIGTEDLYSRKMQKNSGTAACSEFSSFECVDVALETKEKNRGQKTVPKREIQLKRRDTTEADETEKSTPLIQVTNTPLRPRDTFQRQHSTPAAFHLETPRGEQKSNRAERKQRLQKSFSLDETTSKTQMASCIIASVLSKKMQHEEILRKVDISDKTFATTNVDDCLYLSNKTLCGESPKENFLSQCGSLNSETQKELNSTQQPHGTTSNTQSQLMKKHCFNPQASRITGTEVQRFCRDITISSENDKVKKLSQKEEEMWIPNLNPGAKLSCDSAKTTPWNSSAVTNVPTSTECSVKTNLKELQTGQKILSNLLETQEPQAVESTFSPTNIACLISDLEAKAVLNTISQNKEKWISTKEEHAQVTQVLDIEEVKQRGQLSSLALQGDHKFKPTTPVRVVRDMRTLVKSTYNLPFNSTGKSSHGIDSSTLFHSSALGHSYKADIKGTRHDEKPLVRKVTPPLPLDRRRDPTIHHSAAISSTKLIPPVDSNDQSQTGAFTKVSATMTNRRAISKPFEKQDSQVGISKPNAPLSNANLKPSNLTDPELHARESSTIEKPAKVCPKKKDHATSSNSDKDQWTTSAQSFSVAPQVCSQTECSQQKDHETTCIPPRLQSSVGPVSSSILTIASTPMVPSFYYNTNSLGFQTISPHIGAIHGYVQGPVLLQTPHYSHLPPLGSQISLIRTSSSDETTLVKKSLIDPTSQVQNDRKGLKASAQDNLMLDASMGAGSRPWVGAMTMPEARESLVLGHNTPQLLLDPETGYCFYMDMPQRKMLFDPETCQYVEVVLPQQKPPSAVLPQPCAVPFGSFHIAPMYTPQCLPYIPTHPHILPPPGP